MAPPVAQDNYFFLAVLAGLAATACGGRGSEGASDGAAGTFDVARARALANAVAPLPGRAEVLTLAEATEARAVREGAGPRAVELHATAAQLVERVWRVEGREQDASEALELYRSAAREADTPGACDAALRAARLAGDVAHDAVVAYAEVYRVLRRFAATRESDAGAQRTAPVILPGSTITCMRDADETLGVLVAFRPAQRVLEAIDESLQGEGSLARAGAAATIDSGAIVPVNPPRIVSIDAWPGSDVARVVVVLDRPATYRAGDEVLAGETTPHTFLDLDGVDLGRVAREIPEHGIVTRVRAETTSTGSRVLLDLDGHAWRRVFYLNEPYRIVVDVARQPPGTTGQGPRTLSRVVIDPGHGGKDTGAAGPGGVREKDVTLDVARRLALILVAQGIQVMATREDDRFVSLEERTARANAFSADLFVSIHCNASENKWSRGVETYVLDTTRDEIAARLAARENATTQAASAELGAILGGMRLANQAQRSVRFARLLERSAMAALRMRYDDAVEGGVHPAGFYVLVGARMPSVLFETSYISNALDEQRLGSAEYRQLLADAIANAIKAYREGR